jgi:hypothetical protein
VSLRKSSLKNVENLKFIPINLHLEKFLVQNIESTNNSGYSYDFLAEKQNSKETKSCYDFVSVGAFTTVHTNKKTNQKSVETLMSTDMPFKFNRPADKFTDPIRDETIMMFYSLKLLILIGNDLKNCKKISNQSKVFIYC